MTDRAEELTPCPFCGMRDAFTERHDYSSSYVVCNACSSRGPVSCQDDDEEDEPGRDAAIAAWNRRPSTPWNSDMSAAPRGQYRHKKRGTTYTVLGHAELQKATGDVFDGDQLFVYRGEDGKLWAREKSEFLDGRFEPLPPPPVGEER